MTKLEELKQFVAELFDAATDKTTIEKSAVVNQKIDEITAEQTKLNNDYAALLKDYKDVVLHSAFKPESNSHMDSGVPDAVSTFDGDKLIADFLNSHKADGSIK